MMSPKRAPAKAAGPATVASTTSAPLALRSPSERASGSSTGSILTPSQPFWPSVERLPIFTGSLTMRPSGWAGRIGAGGVGAGATGCGVGGGGGGCGETGMMGLCPLGGAARRHANDVYAGAGNSRDRWGWALGSRCRRESLCRPGAVGRDGREHHEPAQYGQLLLHGAAQTWAMPCAQERVGTCRALVIAEAPRQDVLGRFLGVSFLGTSLGTSLDPSLASRRLGRHCFSRSLSGRLVLSVRAPPAFA